MDWPGGQSFIPSPIQVIIYFWFRVDDLSRVRTPPTLNAESECNPHRLFVGNSSRHWDDVRVIGFGLSSQYSNPVPSRGNDWRCQPYSVWSQNHYPLRGDVRRRTQDRLYVALDVITQPTCQADPPPHCAGPDK